MDRTSSGALAEWTVMLLAALPMGKLLDVHRRSRGTRRLTCESAGVSRMVTRETTTFARFSTAWVSTTRRSVRITRCFD